MWLIFLGAVKSKKQFPGLLLELLGVGRLLTQTSLIEVRSREARAC